MWLQLLLVFIAFILLKKYQAKGDTKKNRDNYVSWLMLFLIIQSGFRNVAVGTEVRIVGRVQSREYEKKHEDGTVEKKVAYEVSVASLEVANQEDNSEESKEENQEAI